MASSNRDCWLLKLPVELIQRVTFYLPTTAFCSLRLTSKDIDSATWAAFTHAFFKRKQFMISEFSLQALVDISEHPTLSKCMTNLVIGLDRWSELRRPPVPHTTAALQHCLALHTQASFYASGRAVTLLTKALNNLKALHTIHLRDYDSLTRYRDSGSDASGIIGQWSSYGAPTIRRLQGLRLAQTDTTSLDGARLKHFSDDALRLVMAAVCASTCRPHSILTELKHLQSQGSGISPIALDFGHLGQPAGDVLGNLHTLHLDLAFFDYVRNIAVVMPGVVDSDPFSYPLRKLLSLTPSLTWLRLNFKPDIRHGRDARTITALLVWLATEYRDQTGSATTDSSGSSFHDLIVRAGLHNVTEIRTTSSLQASSRGLPNRNEWAGLDGPAPIQLAKLKQLDIGGSFDMTPQLLSHMINKFATLERLSVVNAYVDQTILGSTWSKSMSVWSNWLEGLADPRKVNLRSLRHIFVRGLGERFVMRSGLDGWCNLPMVDIHVSRQALLAEAMEWQTMFTAAITYPSAHGSLGMLSDDLDDFEDEYDDDEGEGDGEDDEDQDEADENDQDAAYEEEMMDFYQAEADVGDHLYN